MQAMSFDRNSSKSWSLELEGDDYNDEMSRPKISASEETWTPQMNESENREKLASFRRRVSPKPSFYRKTRLRGKDAVKLNLFNKLSKSGQNTLTSSDQFPF